MSTRSMTTPADSSIPELVTQLLAAVVSAALGPTTALKRLRKVEELTSTVGPLDKSVDAFYRWPQRANLALVLAFIGLLCLAFLGGLGRALNWPAVASLGGLYDNGRLLLIAAAVMLLLIGADVFARFTLWWASALRLFAPANRTFGISGDDIGWLQARELVNGAQEPTPLIVRKEAFDRLVEDLLSKVDTSAANPDRASKPLGLDRRRSANVAFIGCILEQMHYTLKWPSREWGPFYAAIAQLAANDAAVTTSALAALPTDRSPYEAVRNALNPVLVGAGQAELPEAGAAATTAFDESVDTLRTHFGASAYELAHAAHGAPIGALAAADAALVRFEPFKGDGMRPQFLKLCALWGVWDDQKPGLFPYPFSKTVAWLLLERGVLAAPKKADILTFEEATKRSTVRAVVARAAEEVANIVETGKTERAKRIEAAYTAAWPNQLKWRVAYEVDLQLWSMARTEHKAGTPKSWTLSDGNIQRK